MKQNYIWTSKVLFRNNCIGEVATIPINIEFYLQFPFFFGPKIQLHSVFSLTARNFFICCWWVVTAPFPERLFSLSNRIKWRLRQIRRIILDGARPQLQIGNHTTSLIEWPPNLISSVEKEKMSIRAKHSDQVSATYS